MSDELDLDVCADLAVEIRNILHLAITKSGIEVERRGAIRMMVLCDLISWSLAATAEICEQLDHGITISQQHIEAMANRMWDICNQGRPTRQ